MSLTMKDREHHANVSQRKESKQSLEEEKAILRRQIQALQNLKSEAQHTLDTSIFKVHNSRHDFSLTNDFSGPQLRNLPIGNLSVKNELFYFAGIQCTKCAKDEFIFIFVAKGEGNKTIVYSVQIFNIDNRGELGKWVLPMFMDIELILKETPLDNITRAAHFVRNCKHHIDCYHNRMDQLIALKISMEDVVNCFPDGNHTYQFINIQLFGVYDAESNNKINIIVYLIYDLKETRPQQIKVDSEYDAPLNKETEKDLISYLKPFKKLTLIEAFESIEKKDDSRFLWKRTEKDQSLLTAQEYQDLEQSSSEESEPQRKRRRKSSLRRSQEESSIENKLTQKIKRRGKIKRKIPVSSGKMSVKDLEYRKRSKKSNKRNFVVKTGAIQRRKDIKYQKPNAADISKFLTQYKHQPESEKESSSKESQPSGKHTAKHTKEMAKLSKLTPTEHIEMKVGVYQKKAQRKDPVIEKIETSEERRVLRSTDSPKKINSPQKSAPKKVRSPKKINFPKKCTPKKVVTPKKIDSPKKSTEKTIPKKKEAPRRRLVTPKKIVLSKKAALSKITISPNTVKTKMKQTNLKFPIPSQKTPTPSQNFPASENTKTIKLDYKSKLLKSKVVTSTPMPLLRKNVKGPVETNLDISNISSNINQEASKLHCKSSVVLTRLEKIIFQRKATANSGIKKQIL